MSASISRIHRQKDSKLGVHVDHVSVRKDELFLALFLARQDDVDLLGSHGKNREVDAVKLIETAPAAGLSQSYQGAERETERQRDRQTDRDRETDRERDRQRE